MRDYSVDDVTFVVIGRNEEMNLARCFKSIQRVTDRIIYVDSNSTDKSIEVARESGVTRIIGMESNFYSASLGRTVGAKRVETRLIQFLDGDMELEETWIPDAIEFLNQHPKAAIVHGFKKEFKKNPQEFTIKADGKTWRPDYLQGAYLIVRDVYVAAGGLDPRFPGEEERDLYVRIHDLGFETWHYDKLMASHYDFKNRGWRYLFFSDVGGVITVPLLKAIHRGQLMAYGYVYRRMLPVLVIDLASLVAILTLTAPGVAVAAALQACALAYTRMIKRPGYFITWKSALLNVHRTARIVRRQINCTEHDHPVRTAGR